MNQANKHPESHMLAVHVQQFVQGYVCIASTLPLQYLYNSLHQIPSILSMKSGGNGKLVSTTAGSNVPIGHEDSQTILGSYYNTTNITPTRHFISNHLVNSSK